MRRTAAWAVVFCVGGVLACQNGVPSTPVVAGTPKQLTFSVQPTNTPANQPVTPAVQVTVRDSLGVTVPTFSGNVSMAIGTGPVGATLSGMKTVAASSGVAILPNLSIDLAASGYTLRASAQGLSAAVSAVFDVTCTANCWTAKTPMPTPRTTLGVGVLNGVLYAVGGSDTTVARLTVEAYNPVTNGWTTKAPIPTTSGDLAVGVVNGILYAVEALGSEAYDPTTNTWTSKAPMPTARFGAGVGVVNGILYAVGGIAASGPTAAVEAYDPTSDTWTGKASLPTALGHVGVGVVNGIIYAVGGTSPSDPAVSSVDAYDPGTNTWTAVAPLPTARTALAVGVVNGILYAVGGATDTSGAVKTVEAYDPTANTWATKAPMPTARDYPGAGVLNNTLYVIGGDAGFRSFGTNEAYQP